jgi:hypothetical protein
MSETPYSKLMSFVAEDQCSLCRFNHKHKEWRCDRESMWKGDSPCLKAQEYICPVAHVNHHLLEDIEI